MLLITDIKKYKRINFNRLPRKVLTERYTKSYYNNYTVIVQGKYESREMCISRDVAYKAKRTTDISILNDSTLKMVYNTKSTSLRKLLVSYPDLKKDFNIHILYRYTKKGLDVALDILRNYSFNLNQTGFFRDKIVLYDGSTTSIDSIRRLMMDTKILIHECIHRKIQHDDINKLRKSLIFNI